MNFLLKGCANFMEVNMSFLKLSGGKCVTFVVLAMLAASSKIALADTTKLICHMNDNIYWVEEGPTTIELNEAQGTVVAINYSAYHRAPQSPFAHIRQGYVNDARTTGPFSATFTADTITWHDVNREMYTNFSIDRTTGVFVGHTFVNGKFNGDTLSYTCHAGQKQF
jgi:hypothetical protein